MRPQSGLPAIGSDTAEPLFLGLPLKALAELWSSGSSRKIDGRLHERILRRLDRPDAATTVKEIDVPGFDFHPLHGKPQRYSVHVNRTWGLTFEFAGGDALRVDLEHYH